MLVGPSCRQGELEVRARRQKGSRSPCMGLGGEVDDVI